MTIPLPAAQAINVTIHQPFDWVSLLVAIATFGLALITVWLGFQARASASAAQKEASATVQLGEEARRDRELAVQPVIVLLDSSPNPGAGKPGIQLANVGRGPAISLRVLQWHSGEVFWSRFRSLAAGQTLPSPLVRELSPGTASEWFYLTERRGAASVELSFADPEPPGDLIAYCLDQLGNGLRFRLRTGDPPERWRPGADPEPPWATALRDPFDYRHANLRLSQPMDAASLYPAQNSDER